MKKLLFITAVLLPVLALGQSPDQNYVKTTTYKEATTSSIPSPTPNQATQSITYFDGLGRPIQQIAHKQAGNGNDMVTHIEYEIAVASGAASQSAHFHFGSAFFEDIVER